MSLVSFIDNPQDEVKRIQSEEEEVKRSDELMYKNVQNEENNIGQSTSNIEE